MRKTYGRHRGSAYVPFDPKKARFTVGSHIHVEWRTRNSRVQLQASVYETTIEVEVVWWDIFWNKKEISRLDAPARLSGTFDRKMLRTMVMAEKPSDLDNFNYTSTEWFVHGWNIGVNKRYLTTEDIVSGIANEPIMRSRLLRLGRELNLIHGNLLSAAEYL
jgi:hypothetical protein